MSPDREGLARLENAYKVYNAAGGDVTAMAGVDLTVSRGEFLGVMGPSGSGKSTLLYVLGCLEALSRGHFILNGQDVSSLNDPQLSAIRASHIGFVFQTFNLVPQHTVRENVAMPFLYREEGGTEADSRVERALELVGLSSRAGHLPNQLSGGEMQRAAIARAVVVDPLMILADEPTGNLDTTMAASILDIFGKLNQKGTTIVLVTHDPLVAARCGRVVRMADGRLAGEGVS